MLIFIRTCRLLGSYEALEGGELADAFVDFTGGFTECLHFGNVSPDLVTDMFTSLFQCRKDKMLVASAISAETTDEMEKVTRSGLVIGHAYAVTRFTFLPVDRHKSFSLSGETCLRLVKLSDPWGGTVSTDYFFANYTESMVKAVNTFDSLNCGEFWMPFDEFIQQFNCIILCHTPIAEGCFRFAPGWLTQEVNILHLNCVSGSLENGKVIATASGWQSFWNCEYPVVPPFTQVNWRHKQQEIWTELQFHSRWSAALSGGCLNHMGTFAENPQFGIDIMATTSGSVAFYLLQKTVRVVPHVGSTTGLYHIGMSVFRVENNRASFIDSFDNGHPIANSVYCNSRSVWLRLHLLRGRYVVVPTTFLAGCTSEFMLRVASSCAISIIELKPSSSLLLSTVLSAPKKPAVQHSLRLHRWLSSSLRLLDQGKSEMAISLSGAVGCVVKIRLLQAVLYWDTVESRPPAHTELFVRLVYFAGGRETNLRWFLDTGSHRIAEVTCGSPLFGRGSFVGLLRFNDSFLVPGPRGKLRLTHRRVYPSFLLFQVFTRTALFDDLLCQTYLVLSDQLRSSETIKELVLVRPHSQTASGPSTPRRSSRKGNLRRLTSLCLTHSNRKSPPGKSISGVESVQCQFLLLEASFDLEPDGSGRTAEQHAKWQCGDELKPGAAVWRRHLERSVQCNGCGFLSIAIETIPYGRALNTA